MVYTNWNEFKRYSETNGRITKYFCYSLIVGLNCPPINDNFHWCRSYIIYLPTVEKEDKIYIMTGKEKYIIKIYKKILM